MTTADQTPATAGPPIEQAAVEGDALTRLRQQLADVGELPVAERVEVFAAVNEALVGELSRMEETDGSHAAAPGALGADSRARRPGPHGGGRRHEGPSAP